MLNQIQSATKDTQIEKAWFEMQYVMWQEQKTMYEASEQETNAETAKAIQEQIIQESYNRNANLLADTALKESKKKLNAQERKNLVNDIEVSLRNCAATEQQARAAARNARSAEQANNIKEAARKDAFTMWKGNIDLLRKKYELEKTDLTYKYGEKTVIHFGNMYSPLTSEDIITTPNKTIK